MIGIRVAVIVGLVVTCFGADPTNYEYYTSGGIKSGLKADSVNFTLNGKDITLLSGSLHYFRLPHQYWKDRLTKFRAGGLNAVQTYAPWNLHEETPGNFDFETGFLNVEQFLKEAQAADLFVVYRIGPYICAEWEMGGYPAWLLRDPNMKLRSNYKPYLEAVGKYFEKILEIVNKYQFTKGGPIIALQFENEYGGIQNANDKEYFQYMKDVIDKSGFKELLINCDPGGDNAAQASKKALPGVLETVNFNSDSLKNLQALRKAQPDKPLHVTEWWPGWFDGWGNPQHHTMSLDHFDKEVNDVLFNANSSINFYMYFGGTNFGFMNGAGGQGSVTTSYDYNAPLSESGNYTDKYYKFKDMCAKLTKERGLPKTLIPDPPKVENAVEYGVVKMKDLLSFEDILKQVKPYEETKPVTMELLNIGSNYGQNFGFINYRITTKKFKNIKFSHGVDDRGILIIDDKQISLLEKKDFQMNTTDSDFSNATDHMLDVFVENMGRINGGGEMNSARKGLLGEVLLDGTNVAKYEIYPLEFKDKFVQSLKQLSGRPVAKITSPSLFRGELTISGEPRDTFLRLDNWKKGSVFINGFNVGRYYDIGPQKTLYIPAPILKTGANDVFVFELHSSGDSIDFVDKPDLGKT